MINYFLKNFLKISLIFILTFFLAEITAKTFVYFGLLDKGLPAWVSLRAHKDFGNWHPKNITLDLEKKNCWQSTVSYNDLGMRDMKEIGQKPMSKKKSIALLGDSMIENIENSDGYDLGSLIQKKLAKYDVYNFSARGTGLADQIEIYKKLIKPNNFDYLFLFITENDIDNNVIGYTSYHNKRFNVVENNVVEIPKNESFFKKYNSTTNIIKRDFFLFFKNLDLYKVYLNFNYFLDVKRRNQTLQKNISTKKFELTEKKIKIYNKIKKDFFFVIDQKTKLIVFLNARPHIFEPDRSNNFKKEYIANKFFKETWSSDSNLYDPYAYIKEKLYKINKFSYPYLSFMCDAHYSSFGADLYSDFITETFLKKVKY